jgi:putative transposase
VPRQRRFVMTGYPVHVTNRGVERRRLFFEADQYEDFLRLLRFGKERYPVSVLGLCLMPNHFHLIALAREDGALSEYLHWVQGIYSRDLRQRTGTSGYGHVFQQRFWSGPIADGWHLRNVLRYVESNPVAGQLVKYSQDWPWGSLALRQTKSPALLDPLPIPLPQNWTELVNATPEEADCD